MHALREGDILVPLFVNDPESGVTNPRSLEKNGAPGGGTFLSPLRRGCIRWAPVGPELGE